MKTREYNLIIVGTFDVENLGDLLFPIMLNSVLTRKQVLKELFLFSPHEVNMPFFHDWKVHSIDMLEDFLMEHDINGIIVGGGDLLRLDNEIGKSFNKTSDAYSLWAKPILLGKRYGIPVVFNCPGAPFAFDNGNRDFVRFLLENVDYLSVRDEYTKHYLEDCGLTRDIRVVPDSILGIDVVYSGEELQEVYTTLINNEKLSGNPYIVFQINNNSFTEADYVILHNFLEKLVLAKKYEIVFMPIGYEHDDHIALEKLKVQCGNLPILMIDRKLHPVEMMALLSNAEMFIGTSLHGAILSYVYQVPFMEIVSGFSTKIYGFCQLLQAEERVVNIKENLWEAFCEIFEKKETILSKTDAVQRLARHFEDMLSAIEKGTERTDLTNALFELCINREHVAVLPRLYLDLGRGYNEQEVFICKEVSEGGSFFVRYNLQPECVGLRFDPIENQFCMLYLEHAISNHGDLKLKSTNGIKLEKGYVFLTQDPIMDWEISNGTEWIELQAKIFTFLPESKVDCLFNEGQVLFNRKLQKLEEQEAHMAMLEKEHAVLQKELEKEEIEKHLLQKQSDEIRRKWQEREVEFALKNQEAENKVKVLEETLLKVKKDAINLEDALLEVKLKVESLEQELENREAKNLDLSRMQEGLVQEKIFLQEQYHSQKEMIVALENRVFELTDSTCWKITKPIRVVGIFLKKLVKPKTYGRMLKRIYMAFPLSMGTKLKVKGALFTVLAPLIKNTEPYRDWKNYNAGCVETEAVPQKINERQVEKGDYVSQILNIPLDAHREEYEAYSEKMFVRSQEDVKYLAFYLPQFHPFEENDSWWGKGFTEWTNVTKAVPQFVGHYQPRLAGELGYYDLRYKENIEQQMKLAKQYGIYGFCIYYYWFDGKKLMDTPLNLIMEDENLNLPFCLCWANENWSRKWDGKNQDILIAQNYDESFALKFIKDIVVYMQDSRYIRVNEKPILVIYNANEIPNLKLTIHVWRDYCRDCGVGEIHLLAVDFALNVVSKEAGFDGFVEFPPHSVYHYGMEKINSELEIMNEGYQGQIFDYTQIVREKKYLKNNTKDYYKGIFLGWDNTARRPQNATVYHRFSIQAFKEWLMDITCFTKKLHSEKDNFVFINAWNEWAEGTYLEPDRRYGYAALEAVRDTLTESKKHQENNKRIIYVCHDACYNGAQMLSLNIIEQLKKLFHYNVYVVLLGGGVLINRFRELSTDLICLEDVKNPQEALETWLQDKHCKKAFCNTVVTGDAVKWLSEQGITCISLIHEMEMVVRQYQCEKKLQNITEYAHKVVFASEYVRKSVEKIHNIPQDKVVILPQGIYKNNPYGGYNEKKRTEIRRKFKLTENCRLVLGVGFGDYRKGFDLFVKAALKACKEREDIAFIWVGEIEPNSRKEADKLLEAAHNREHIIFAGATEDVFQYYSAADVFVLTSREDPFPTVVLEAMSAGLPVVAFSDGGGYVENINKQTGILVPMEDWEALADAVVQLTEAERQLREMGQSAKQYVEKHFGFVDYIYDLLRLLEETYHKVSVIIPNYNYAKYLPMRIESVMEQDYPIYEILLLDDNSKDSSVQVMQQYQQHNPLQIKILVNEENSGNVFCQWEKGCNIAKGEYLWIAEADDLAKPTLVSSLVTRMEKDTKVIMGYVQSYMMDETGKVTERNYLSYTNDVDEEKWRRDYVSDTRDEITKCLAVKNTIPNVSAVMFKNQDFSVMFQEAKKYQVAGDWAFYVKLLEQGGKVVFVAESLNYHRRHTNSVTADLKAQTHFKEICTMQDYIGDKYQSEVDKDSVLKYREKVGRILGVLKE